MQSQIIETIKKLKPQLNEDFNVEEIALFGSYSRNENNDSSDIDILVKLNKPLGLRFITLLNLLKSQLKLKVDLVTDKALRSSMKSRILKEAIYI
jgi:predicted nucleotidyltransferase